MTTATKAKRTAPTATTEQLTAALVRQAFHAVPDGARYYVTSIKTPAGGGSKIRSRAGIAGIVNELREARADETVTHMTIFVLYDGRADGAARGQALLPLGGDR